MDNRTAAVFAVKLGMSYPDACKKFKLTESTLRRAVKNYKPPQHEVLDDLLAEGLAGLLLGGLKGSDLTGAINAINHLHSERASNSDIITALLELGELGSEELADEG
jgi:hypothetical protein